MAASVYGGDAGEEGVNLFSLSDYYVSEINLTRARLIFTLD